MRGKGLIPWRRKGILPGFFDLNFDTDDFLDMFNFNPIRVDVKETENEYTVEADLPGYDKNNIEIRYENNSLVISAEHDEVTEEKRDNYIHHERRRGNFTRSIPFPDDIKSDSIKASYKNGVLKVVLPKVAPSKPSGRIIDIE
ncbi:MAG: Hsp20/alpha crystallin family protein [Tepidanaerobacteraceae bacterium]|nr:Hsp20/alpha crystallin family protein [Thermoanaerobacterales bacterium]